MRAGLDQVVIFHGNHENSLDLLSLGHRCNIASDKTAEPEDDRALNQTEMHVIVLLRTVKASTSQPKLDDSRGSLCWRYALQCYGCARRLISLIPPAKIITDQSRPTDQRV